jgi:hypothetical protein
MKCRTILTLAVVSASLFSCSNKDKSTYELMIPDDASLVLHVSGSSLNSKIGWDEISKTSWFQDMASHTEDSTARNLLNNPESSGLNTKGEFYMFDRKQGTGGYAIVAGAVTDKSAFEKFCLGLHKDQKLEVKKEGSFSYITSDQGAIVWNSSHFAFAHNSENIGPSRGFMGRKGFRPEGLGERKQFLPDSLKFFAMQALTPKNSHNLQGDTRFAALVKDGKDIHLWMNGQGIASSLSSMSPVQLSDLVEGNVSTISFNFDNGKITAHITQYYGDKMKKVLSKHTVEPLTADLINRIPATNVFGVIAWNYAPEDLREILSLSDAGQAADVALSATGFNIDDFIKANKGKVLISVSEASPAATTRPATTGKGKGAMPPSPVMKNMPNILFATAVADKASFENMITAIWDGVKKFGGGMGAQGDLSKSKLPFDYKLDNNWFAASNSPGMVDQFLAGGNSKFPFADRFAGHTFGMYIDLQKLMLAIPRKGGSVDSTTGSGMAEALKTWQDIFAVGGDYKDGVSQYDYELNMVDKNTNSLKQLNQYFENLHKLKKSRPKLELKEVTLEEIKQADTKRVPPPPPPAKKKLK